jgi:hypothetical protein
MCVNTRKTILSFLLLAVCTQTILLAQPAAKFPLSFDFYGERVSCAVEYKQKPVFCGPLTAASTIQFIEDLNATSLQPLVDSLVSFRQKHNLDDWLYYQLIRKTAQQLNPKAANYYAYTLVKWYLLTRSGYNATIRIAGDQILFYVQCDENIYNIPGVLKNGIQYICLNYHDYGNQIDFEKNRFREIELSPANGHRAFSYKVKSLPRFTPASYTEKEIGFSYNDNHYQFKIKLNPDVMNIFRNYPVVDYESYFNIPLSRETYSTLIPALKRYVKGMNQKNGVDFLMRFTRYTFLFNPDSLQFGAEKRLSPEQTLLYEQSDCEDRAALFFYLVREIYNLPMIVLAYPKHVTIAVKFSKPVGNTIVYNGEQYTVCEPTPQEIDLSVGQLIPGLSKTHYEIAYAYTPGR